MVAGCGGGSGNSNTSSSANNGGGSSTSEEGSAANSPPTSEEKPASNEGEESGEAAKISVASAGDLGEVLVEGEGMTVYDFHKDKGGKSTCYGPCEELWPPVLTSG